MKNNEVAGRGAFPNSLGIFGSLSCALLLLMAALSAFGQEAATNAQAVAVQAEQVAETNAPPSAETMLAQAVTLRKGGEGKEALETVAQAIAQNPTNQTLMASCELLAAALYLEQGMTNEAAVTARQIRFLHEGTEFADKARALSERISNNERRMEQ